MPSVTHSKTFTKIINNFKSANMKFSMTLVALSAALTMASPMQKRAEIVVVTETVKKVVYVDPTPAPAPKKEVVWSKTGNFRNNAKVKKPKPEPSQAPAPVEVKAPEPEPTPAPAPAPAPEPEVVVPPVQVLKEEPKKEEVKQEAPAPAPAPAPVQTEEKAAAAPGGQPTDLQSASLYYHNVHRANHSVDALSWDSGIASAAAQLAATCHWEHDTKIGGGGYGQNLAMMAGSGYASSRSNADDVKAMGNSITNMWYDGEYGAYFDNVVNGKPNEGMFTAWGHLSQVLWKGTSTVGCAINSCAQLTYPADQNGRASPPTKNAWYVVCNYKGAGNMAGQYDTNVLPGKGAATLTV